MSHSAKCLHASINLELQNAQNQKPPKAHVVGGKDRDRKNPKIHWPGNPANQ